MSALSLVVSDNSTSSVWRCLITILPQSGGVGQFSVLSLVVSDNYSFAVWWSLTISSLLVLQMSFLSLVVSGNETSFSLVVFGNQTSFSLVVSGNWRPFLSCRLAKSSTAKLFLRVFFESCQRANMIIVRDWLTSLAHHKETQKAS